MNYKNSEKLIIKILLLIFIIINNKIVLCSAESTFSDKPKFLKTLSAENIANQIILNKINLAQITKLPNDCQESIRIALAEKSKVVLLKKFKDLVCIPAFYTYENSSVSNINKAMIVRFSPCGKFILAVFQDNTIKLLDIRNLNEIIIHDLIGHSNVIYFAKFSNSGKFFLTCSLDGTAKLWDIENLDEIKEYTFKGDNNTNVKSVDISQCGHYIVMGMYDGSIIIRDVRNLKAIVVYDIIRENNLVGHRNAVISIKFSPYGKYIISGAANEKIILWNISDLDNISSYELPGNITNLKAVEFSFDGKMILAAFCDDLVKVWDIRNLNNIKLMVLPLDHDQFGNGEIINKEYFVVYLYIYQTKYIYQIKNFKINRLNLKDFDIINAIKFSNCKQYVLTGTDKGSVKLWDIRDINNIISIDLENHNQKITSVDLSPCGKFAVVGVGAKVKLYALNQSYDLTLQGLINLYRD